MKGKKDLPLSISAPLVRPGEAFGIKPAAGSGVSPCSRYNLSLFFKGATAAITE